MATIPKDKTEEALERALFGTNETFLDSLRNHEDISGEEDYLDEEEDLSDVAASDDDALEEVDDSNLFFFDTGLPSQGTELSKSQDDQALVTQDEVLEPENLATWHDSDDERVSISLAANTRLRKLRVSEQDDLVSGTEYARRLRLQFQRLNPAPEWTDPEAQSERRRKRRRLSESSMSPSDSETDSGMSSKPLAALLQSSQPLIEAGNSTHLRAGAIDIQRTKDVNIKPASCKLALHFHPQYPILLSSSVSGQICLHHITSRTATPNPLLTSIAARSMSVTTADFHSSGTKIYFSGRRRYFYSWDLITGKAVRITRMYGHAEEQRSFETFKLSPDGRYIAVKGTARKGGGTVNVVDATTCQWICQARVDSVNGVADFAWWSDSTGLVVIGKGGEAIEYSVVGKRAVARWRDEGAVGTTVIALGRGASQDHVLGRDTWVVVGSSSGIVNIYDRSSWPAVQDIDGDLVVPLNPKPVKVLSQLTTPISNVVFSPDSQLLSISSQWKKDALRLVHVDSLSVYKNWPTSSTPLGRVTAVAFSSDSKMIAIGNEQGRIRLWDIKGS